MMTGFFNLLLGAIDLPSVCWALSVNPERKNEILEHSATYGVCKGKIDDCTWNTLVNVLASDTFRTLLDSFLSQFKFPLKLREQMVDIYGLNEDIAYSFDIDFSKVRLQYCHELENTSDMNQHIILVRIEMTKLAYFILDPCITMLLSTYYQALLNYIDFSQKYSTIGTNYFHNPESCSPWIEELFCLAFIEVLGNSENSNSCRISEVPQVDRLSAVPAYVLKTVKGAPENKLSKGQAILDQSIICINEKSSITKNGAKEHLYAWRNRISSYAQNSPLVCHASDLIYIDSFYGYSYDYELLTNDTALYGDTKYVPAPFDWLVEEYPHDWLRVPFIKVPRYKAHSAKELYKFIKNMAGWGCLFRGQTSEYYLNRSKPLMKKLYGDAEAIEPSLASYAIRKSMMFEEHYVEWASIIKAYFYSILGGANATEFLSQFDDLNYYLLCLSVAQHYGLPTYGLDVTTSLATALFFAIYQFTEIDSQSNQFKYIRKDSGTSIIYVFKPTRGETFDYDRFNLNFEIFPRPFMQKASFAHCSWGYAKNAIAERLVAAIQFDVSAINFQELNSLLRDDHYPELYEENFFAKVDCFIDFLHSYITNDFDTYNSDFKMYLKKYIYQI